MIPKCLLISALQLGMKKQAGKCWYVGDEDFIWHILELLSRRTVRLKGGRRDGSQKGGDAVGIAFTCKQSRTSTGLFLSATTNEDKYSALGSLGL